MQESPIYISKEGIVKLEHELEYLRTTKRPETVERLEKAKEMGDLRENADYAEAKDELANIEMRVLEIQYMLKRAVIIEKGGSETITVGSHIKVQVNGKQKEFDIVGSREADPLAGKLSNESPIGIALMGKRVGDTAEVKVPAGMLQYTVLEIQ